MKATNKNKYAPRIQIVDLTIKIPIENQDKKYMSYKTSMLTQKVELMNKEFASFKKEVKNVLASLKVEVLN